MEHINTSSPAYYSYQQQLHCSKDNIPPVIQYIIVQYIFSKQVHFCLLFLLLLKKKFAEVCLVAEMHSQICELLNPNQYSKMPMKYEIGF